MDIFVALLRNVFECKTFDLVVEDYKPIDFARLEDEAYLEKKIVIFFEKKNCAFFYKNDLQKGNGCGVAQSKECYAS